MPSASKKTATKQATTKKSATKKTVRKSASRKPADKTPSLTKTVNMGPERGDNSFPPGNKPATFDRSRTVRTSPARDSSSGPGGKAAEGRAKDKR